MPISIDLKKLMDESLEKVRLNPQHHLPLGYREAIYSLMGPYRFLEGNSDEIGYRRRVTLAVIAVSKVALLWKSIWPKDDTVETTLSAAQDIMYKTPYEIDSSSIAAEIERLWNYTTELTDDTREIAGVVGMAAVRTLSLALWDGYMSDEGIDFERTDDIDFMFNDMHFYAATAYADGPPYPIALASTSNPTKRQEFWEWWITTAVPTAWESVSVD